MNLRCSAYLAGLVQVIEWPFEDGALQALVRPYKATVAYKFDRTVSQHLSYVYSGSAARVCAFILRHCHFGGIAALAALPLWRHCRFGRHCRCDEFRRCHVLTLPFRVQTTACKQLLILVHLSLNISKTIYRQASIISCKGMPWRGCVRCSATAAICTGSCRCEGDCSNPVFSCSRSPSRTVAPGAAVCCGARRRRLQAQSLPQ